MYHNRPLQLRWWEIQHIDAISASGLLKVLKPMAANESQLQTLLHALIDEQHYQLIAVGENSKILAVAALRGAECCLFRVRHDMRRKGIGRYLLDCLCQQVAAQGEHELCVDLVGMDASELDSVLPFLKQTGFKAEAHNKMRWIKSGL